MRLCSIKNNDISGLDAPEEVIDYARKRFDEIARENSNHVYIGVGVAVSGIFDLATQTLVNCAVKMYEGVPLKAIVEKASSFRAMLIMRPISVP